MVGLSRRRTCASRSSEPIFDAQPAQLENEVNRLVAMSDDVITSDLLSTKIREGTKVTAKSSDGLAKYYDRSLKDVEYEFMRDIILHTLEDTNWHRTKAAKILKVPTSTLFNKMKKYGIG